ncbi:hypothetical protein V7123_27080, partial [Bacillus toyonensis]|uniref:hypothetical protein n=1 Tax=Bacillus toyonensis TaxID=155322 RepID=UPI002FFF30B0
VGIKQKAIKTIKVLANKDVSGTTIEQFKKALPHFKCSKAFIFLSVVFLICGLYLNINGNNYRFSKTN